MATRAIFTPYGAEFESAGNPGLDTSNDRPVLAFDAASRETAIWTMMAPQGLSGTPTLVVSYKMATATASDVSWFATVEAVTDADASDLDASTFWDSANPSDGVTVPGTAGYIDQISITLTNNDSMAAADYVRVALSRDAALDTASGDADFLVAEFRDTA